MLTMASITGQLTDLVGRHGAYAVFLVMAMAGTLGYFVGALESPGRQYVPLTLAGWGLGSSYASVHHAFRYVDVVAVAAVVALLAVAVRHRRRLASS